MISLFISKVDYASDQEWFRYFVINTSGCIGLILFNLAQYFNVSLNNNQFFSILNYVGANENNIFNTETKLCKDLFTLNFVLGSIAMVYITGSSFVQFVNVFFSLKSLFLLNNGDMIAVSEDPDIVVIN